MNIGDYYMKEEKKQSLYEFNLIGANKVTTFSFEHLIDIDSLLTNFKNKEDIINYLNANYDNGFEINNISVNYDRNIIEMIFSDARDIVNGQGLVSKIFEYLSHYDNIKNLDLLSLNDKFLVSKINEIMYSSSVNQYNFRLNNFKKDVLNGYKHKRKVALLIDRRKKEIGKRFFNMDYINMFDKYEVEGILMGLGIPLKGKKENTQDDTQMDEYLQYLIANKDKIEDFPEELSRNKDIEDLDGYDEIDVYDGNRGKRR